MEKDQKKPQSIKKPTLKEETLNKETLDILKKINTGVSKISLVNKNVLKINDGVKSLNAKIVNTNLGVKSMNMKLSKIDVNMAKLLNTMTKQKGKNGKGVSYLDEQLQNETLAQAKKTNVTLDKILVAVSKNGTTIKKDGGSGLLGGLLAVTGLKMLGGMIGQLTDLIPGGKAGKVAGGVAAGMGGAGVLGKVLGKGGGIGKTLKFVGKGGLWGTLGLIGLNSLFGDKKIDLPIPDEWKETGAYKRLVGVGFVLEDKIETAVKDALPEINIAQKDWWKDMFGGVGETLYDMAKNYSKDIGNMFDESTKKTLMGFFNQDWMKMETWEKLYSDPDNFLRKMGEAGMKLNSSMGIPRLPMLDVGPYSGSSTKGKTNIPANIESVIRDTAKQYGLSEDYMKTMAGIESNFNSNAHNTGSGAKGLYQFIPDTAKEYGIVGDEFDAKTSADAAARLTLNNIKTLKARGVPITEENLYLAHQQGATGAADLYAASRGEIGVSDAMRKRIESNLPDSMKGKNVSPAQFIAYYDKKYRNRRDRIKDTESLSAAPEKQFSVSDSSIFPLSDIGSGQRVEYSDSSIFPLSDIGSGQRVEYSDELLARKKQEVTDYIENKKAKEVELIDSFINNYLTPKSQTDNMGLFSSDKGGYGRGPIVPVKEAPTTNQLQSSAIEKDKLSMTKPEPQQPNVISQVVNNGGVGQETQKIDSFSPFDIYTKGLHNPYYNRA